MVGDNAKVCSGVPASPNDADSSMASPTSPAALQKFLTLVAKSYLTLCDPMDCNLAGSSVYRISQARILEWVAISFSRESS